MVQVSYPGVYVEEVPSGVHTVTNVSTSIAAFIGRTAFGPLNKAIRCLSPSDFLRTFGGAHPDSDLAQSVRMFFDNGGTDCYVVRIAHNAKKAEITLKNLAKTNVLTATAKYAGVLGNSIRLEVDYNCSVNPHDAFNLTVIQENAGVVQSTEVFNNLNMDSNSPFFAPDYITQNSSIIELKNAAASPAGSGYSESRNVIKTSNATDLKDEIDTLISNGAQFEISLNGSQFVPVDLSGLNGVFSGSTAAAMQADVLDKIKSEIDTQAGSVIPGSQVQCEWVPIGANHSILKIKSDSGDNSSVRVKSSSENDFAGPMMLGTDQGGIEVSKYGELRPASTGTFLDLSGTDASKDINDIAALSLTDTGITINGYTVTLTASELGGGNPWYQDNSGNSDGLREKLKAIADKVNNDSAVTSRAEVWGYQLAFIPTDGTINAEVSIASTEADFASSFVSNIRQFTLGNTGSGDFQANGTLGQDDDGNAPDANDYEGGEISQFGMHALDPVDLFNLMVIPNDRGCPSIVEDFSGKASNYCQSRRAFLLVDPPATWTKVVNGTVRPEVKNDTSLIKSLRLSLVKDYSAVFYPKLKYISGGLIKTIGASGAIAGLMARTDGSRGVWKAPAGIGAGIKGINGVEVELTDAENGVLNKKGVNCIRVFPNGIVNWGGRTLDGDDDFGSEWKYIPVRRLALMIEESLFRGTQWVVFEPNDEPLWAQIRMNLGAYMNSLFRQGAFQGSNPKQAYYVKCDKETTTQNDINQGIVNIEVGFAPLKPAEFVVIKIQQMSGEL